MINQSNNKGQFIKSIFIHYTLHGINALHERHRNLSPNGGFSDISNKNLKTHQKIKDRSTFRTCSTVQYKPIGTSIVFTHDIPALDDMYTQDILEWKAQLLNLQTICGWREIELRQVIVNAINPIYISQINVEDNSTTIFNILIKMVYNDNTVHELLTNIQNTLQADFTTIHEYKAKLEQLTTLIGIASGWNSLETSKRLAEIFYQNLHPITKLEIQKYNLKKVDEIFAHIDGIEKLFHQQIEHLKITRDQRKLNSSAKKRMYCEYHNSTTHDTKDCKAYAKFKENKDLNVYQETKVVSTLIQLKIMLGKHNIDAIVDTGAQNNYMSLSNIKQLGLEKRKIKRPIFTKLANGKVEEVKEEVVCDIQL